MSSLLAMFAKHWTPGQVKSRLAASLGPVRAAAIHRLFVETLANRLRGMADDRAIAFAPTGSREAFGAIGGACWRLLPQVDGDLGERMQAFIDEALQRADRVVLIGSDSPDLPSEFVDQAFAALQSCDVVLGPATDGGYYLVGAARRTPAIFASIDWGTDRVWRQTIERLRDANCQSYTLPEWFDVDYARDLDALLSRLMGNSRCDALLIQLRNSVQALLSTEHAL